MAEQTTKQEVSVVQTSKHERRLAKSDIFSGISTTGTGTIGKNPSTNADLVEGMLIKLKDKEEYYTDEKSAMVDRDDKLIETAAKEISKANVSNILKTVLSKSQEDKEPPDGDTSGKTQAQPRLSKLLKRVLRENKGSLESSNSAEDTPSESKNEDESKNEEENFELTTSAKRLLVRVLKKRADARKLKEGTEDANIDEEQEEVEEDSPKIKASEGQRFEAFANVLNRLMADNTAGEEQEEEGREENEKEEGEMNATTGGEQNGTAGQGPIILTPAARGVLVRALRKRAELKKRREESTEKEGVDKPKTEDESETQKQRCETVARVLNRIIREKRESEDRQDEDREGTGQEKKTNETNSEAENMTPEQSMLALTPAARGLLIRALRKRAETRKNKAAVSNESSNKETGEETNMEKNDTEGEVQHQEQSQEQNESTKEGKAEDDIQNENEDSNNTKQINPKVNRVVKRAFSNRKKQAFQSQDKGFSGVVQRSLDLQDAENNRIKKQEDIATEQENNPEGSTTSQRLIEENDAEAKADITKTDSGDKEEEVKATEANGDKLDSGTGGVEDVKEGRDDGDNDSPHVSTAESEPSSCSGACVII